MNGDLLGVKLSASAAPIDQMVVPVVGLPASSVQRNAAPPHSCTSMPKCVMYQVLSATGSLAWKKIPPIPVTLFIYTSGRERRRTQRTEPSIQSYRRRADGARAPLRGVRVEREVSHARSGQGAATTHGDRREPK